MRVANGIVPRRIGGGITSKHVCPRLFLAATLLCLTGFRLSAQETSHAASRSTTNTKPPAASHNSLEEFSDTVEQLIRRVNPAVLQIVSENFGQRDEHLGGNAGSVSQQTGEGTGFVISPDGDLITNAHVIVGALRVRVRLHESGDMVPGRVGRSRLVDAQVVGVDRETDLALLKLPGSGWTHLRLADSALLRQGQLVFALGNPRGLENSLSMGVVSAVARQIHPDAAQAFIQTDAPINPGNSGGPLINARGEVVGVNTFIFTASGGSEGLGFAIPSNLVRDVYAQLKKYGRVRRGELGVIIRSLTPAIAMALGLARDEGVLVQDVRPGGPAADAGLRCDDIVVRVQGRPVRNVRQFSNSLFRSEIGEKLTMEVVRGGQTINLQAPLEEHQDVAELIAEQVKEKASPIPQLGVLVIPMDETTAELVPEPRYKSGAIVAATLQTSSSFQEELEPGDIILGVNGKFTGSSIDAIKQILDGLPDGSPLVVQVQREGLLRYLLLRGD
jgi:serine protease Do